MVKIRIKRDKIFAHVRLFKVCQHRPNPLLALFGVLDIGVNMVSSIPISCIGYQDPYLRGTLRRVVHLPNRFMKVRVCFLQTPALVLNEALKPAKG